MEKQECLHEETLSYGLTVFQDATLKVVQVMCDDCRAFGTVVETWSDEDNDYTHDSEMWHSLGSYRNLINN